MATLTTRPKGSPMPPPTVKTAKTTREVPETTPVVRETTPAVRESTSHIVTRYVWAGLRIALGWIFLWAFLDKTFGFGFATPEARSWINGGSPTKGFLSNATGPFEGFYHEIAGSAWANWLFMLGLAGIGIALIAGIGMRIAAVTGGILLVMMWTASLPLDNNPFMDDHLVYAGLLAALALVGAGRTFGFGRIWEKIALVKRMPWLK